MHACVSTQACMDIHTKFKIIATVSFGISNVKYVSPTTRVTIHFHHTMMERLTTGH